MTTLLSILLYLAGAVTSIGIHEGSHMIVAEIQGVELEWDGRSWTTSHKAFCYDRKPCLKARSKEKSRIYREKYREEVTEKKVKPHIKQVDGFIPQAEKYADETVPRHSTDQGKAERDGAFHSEMNRLTIGAGLRVDFS